MATEATKKWMDWYRNKGGRARKLAQRKALHWMSKKEYEELTAQ